MNVDANPQASLIGASTTNTPQPPISIPVIAQPVANEWPQQHLYRPFVKWSLIVALTLGFSAGAGMLALPALGVDRSLWVLKHAQFHGQAQIFGFAGLFTMGVAFHVVPRFRRAAPPFPTPQRAALVLILAGVFLRSFGQAMSHRPVGPYMLYGSGITLLLGTLVFAVTVAIILKRGNSPRTPVELWIAAGATWAVIAGAIHFWAMIEMGRVGAPVVNGAWEFAIIYSGIFGFVINIIFAVSTRAVTGFMNLRPGFQPLRYAAMLLINAGVAIFVAGRLLSWDQDLIGLGMIWLATGLIMFAISLRVFERPTSRRLYIAPAYGRYEWFVKAAFGWLVVGAVLLLLQGLDSVFSSDILPALTAAPVIHVFTIGFITQMIFGVSSRMVPLFEPTALPHHRALDAAFVLLNLSVGLRLFFGLGTPATADGFLAISGVAALAALVAYAVPMFKSMRSSARARYAETMSNLSPERLHQIETYRATKLPLG